MSTEADDCAICLEPLNNGKKLKLQENKVGVTIDFMKNVLID
jgi:hypothetical protein